MEVEKMFEKATRMKLRFPFKGMCTVEDLWDLSTRNLDGIYKTLRKEQKAQDEDSLLETKSAADTVLNLQVQIVEYVAKVKIAEEKARKDSAARGLEKARILEVIAEKEEGALKDLSIEELKQKVAAL